MVGFGFPDPAHRFGIRDVDFGWIVAPRSREGGKFEQIDGQYALTAFISVPGWWQTAEISIATCWLSRTELASSKTGQGAARICPHELRLAPKPIVVKLPASVPEISAKLGFNVIRHPSLYHPEGQILVVGGPGSILLNGVRLWRSTEVTAGSQRANKITVLPNMEGIIAEFDCVAPPPPDPELQQWQEIEIGNKRSLFVTKSSLRVWTSEGVTEPIGVTFIWPDKDLMKAFATYDACERNKNAGKNGPSANELPHAPTARQPLATPPKQ